MNQITIAKLKLLLKQINIKDNTIYKIINKNNKYYITGNDKETLIENNKHLNYITQIAISRIKNY
jgi:hypothetical protein